MQTATLGACSLITLFFITLPAQAAPVQWTVASGGNGHFYEFVPFTNPVRGEQSWLESKAEAEAAGGYLATITSAGEQAFLESINTFGTESFWIGASDATTEGTWRWETGPEAGQQFWQGFSNGNTTPPFDFASWLPGEPNSAGEDYGAFIGDGFTVTGWNDVVLTNTSIRGYVLETPIPLPGAAWLFSAALGVLGFWRKHRR